MMLDDEAGGLSRGWSSHEDFEGMHVCCHDWFLKQKGQEPRHASSGHRPELTGARNTHAIETMQTQYRSKLSKLVRGQGG